LMMLIYSEQPRLALASKPCFERLATSSGAVVVVAARATLNMKQTTVATSSMHL
jgi:hypothetical protein